MKTDDPSISAVPGRSRPGNFARSFSRFLAALAVSLALIGLLAIGYVFLASRDLRIDGPASSTGYTLVIDVTDRGIGPGADHYTNISILGRDGAVAAKWEDPDGQQSSEDVDAVIRSLRWVSPTELEFRTEMRGRVVLSAGS